MKARLGMRKVRPWKWMPFKNSARKDSLVLHHWRRATDEGKDYPFAKFNKKLDCIPAYTDIEYANHLKDADWSKEETDHLLDLCTRFDLRFTVIHDRLVMLLVNYNQLRVILSSFRYDQAKQFNKNRSIEDLKERYYDLCDKLEHLHADPSKVSKPYAFDAAHERKRKEQLIKLYNRTQEEVNV